MLVIWPGHRRGAWWETGTIKCGVLRGIHLAGGPWAYTRGETRSTVVGGGHIQVAVTSTLLYIMASKVS